MDCEGFDEVALDLVYDDGPGSQALDEARRHADGCSRCAASLAALRQARGAVELPPLPVPAALERAILAEVDRRQQEHAATWWGRLDRAISILGSYAMRPQTAMGALLVLMTGLSLVLLRARPAERGTVRITENGVPANEPRPAVSVAAAAAPVRVETAPSRRSDDERPPTERPAGRDRDTTRDPASEPVAPPVATATATAPPMAIAAAPAAASMAAAAGKADTSESPQEAAYAAAMEHYKARRYADAMRAFDIVANGGGSNGSMAALYAARSARYASGCGAAVSRFEAIATRQVGSGASEATWEAAVCYRELGQLDRARQLFGTLRRVAGYRDRVEKELAAIEQRPAAAADPPRAGAKPTNSR